MSTTLTLAAAKTIVVAADGRIKDEVAAKSAAFILAAIGHPGYGRAFSEKVILSMAANGYSAHQVIYNGWGL